MCICMYIFYELVKLYMAMEGAKVGKLLVFYFNSVALYIYQQFLVSLLHAVSTGKTWQDVVYTVYVVSLFLLYHRPA